MVLVFPITILLSLLEKLREDVATAPFQLGPPLEVKRCEHFDDHRVDHHHVDDHRVGRVDDHHTIIWFPTWTYC